LLLTTLQYYLTLIHFIINYFIFSLILIVILKQLQDLVSSMIAQQGEDAEWAAWICTKEDIHMKDEICSGYGNGYGDGYGDGYGFGSGRTPTQ